MTPLWYLTRRSIANRGLTVVLTIVAVALSVAMLLGVERLRSDAREGFAQTISGTDLVVGARSGAVQLLLCSVFHIGDATNNVSWKSLQTIAGHPQVEWLVPLSLGDSHRGFRVVGTTAEFFERYRYAEARELRFEQGRPFDDVFDAVIGAEVAARLGYTAGDAIVVAHGTGDVSFAQHDDKPFTVVGVLARTGTPVDRSVLVSLAGIEAIHLDWAGGARMPGLNIPAEQVRRFDLEPKEVTAALVGLKSRVAVFRVQRYINTYPDEALTAALPGATLQQLWGHHRDRRAGLAGGVGVGGAGRAGGAGGRGDCEPRGTKTRTGDPSLHGRRAAACVCLAGVRESGDWRGRLRARRVAGADRSAARRAVAGSAARLAAVGAMAVTD
jgi:putative ABC transport system permease protein